MMQSVPLTEGQVGTTTPKARRSVRIHLAGALTIEGELVLPQTRGIAEILNNSQPFMEMVSADGRKLHIAKASVQALEILDITPRVDKAH